MDVCRWSGVDSYRRKKGRKAIFSSEDKCGRRSEKGAKKERKGTLIIENKGEDKEKKRNSVVRIKITTMCKKFSYSVLFHPNVHTDMLHKYIIIVHA